MNPADIPEGQAVKAKTIAEGSITGNPTMGQPLRVNGNTHILDCKASGLTAAIVIWSPLINREDEMINS
jgi:type IV secretory pathway TraG/TraD family ATPase VirD4